MTFATAATPQTSPERAMIWTGRALSGLVVAFLLLDAAIKLPPIQPVIDTMGQLGWPTDAATARMLAVLTIAATALYVTPRTALIGAILLTAYLGGAVATHVRIGSPLLTHSLFGAYVGLAAWAGLYLRDARLRAILH